MLIERLDVEAQSRAIRKIVESEGIGTDHCKFARDIVPVDGKGLKTCTCDIEPYPDMPMGCGCFQFGHDCWAVKK